MVSHKRISKPFFYQKDVNLPQLMMGLFQKIIPDKKTQ